MSETENAYEPPKTPAEPAAGKRRFTLVELLVVIAIIGVLVVVLLPMGRGVPREAVRRMQCSNHLKEIALALHDYHNEYGEFPPAYIADEDGRAMHSWRVLILPYLYGRQGTVYEKYSFDEPWDGPHNRELWDQIPSVFRCPSYSHDGKHHDDGTTDPEQLTQYVALVGPETIFPGGESRGFEDVTDGTANTLLVVELYDHCVHWMSPRDVAAQKFANLMAKEDSDDASPSHHPGGVNVALGDGSVRFISQGRVDAKTLRAMTTRAAGDEVSSDY